jgi:hypothetical protein
MLDFTVYLEVHSKIQLSMMVVPIMEDVLLVLTVQLEHQSLHHVPKVNIQQ